MSPELRARLAAEAFARSPPTTPRSPPTSTRSRATRSRAGWRWSSRRSTTCATARTPTSGPRSIARRRTAAGRSPTRRSSRADRPSFNNLLDLDAAYRIAARLHGADRRDREAHRPGRPGLERRARRGLPPRARDRPGRLVRRRSSASTASSTARRPARSPRTRTRRWSRPGFSEAAIGILRGKPGLELLAVPPDPTEGMRDYGIASLDFKRVGGGLLVETPGRARPRPRPAPGRHQAPPDARGADRPAVRLARGAARPLERDRARQERGDGRDRRRPGQPPGVGRDRAAPRRRPGQDSRSWPSDAYFPFPDGIQLAARPA